LQKINPVGRVRPYKERDRQKPHLQERTAERATSPLPILI